MLNVECRMQNAELGVRSEEYGNGECGSSVIIGSEAAKFRLENIREIRS